MAPGVRREPTTLEREETIPASEALSEARETVHLSGGQVSAFRLHRHHLDVPASRGRLPAVVGDTGGVQTQVPTMAQMALWARIQDLTLDDVDRARQKTRTIVKTWSLRNALHLHRSSDLPNILGGLMGTRLAKERRWIEGTGLREEETTRLVVDALEDGPLLRSQLVARLSKTLGVHAKDWMDGGWGVKKVGSSTLWHLARPAMARGLVCFGPSDGPEISFVRVEQWFHKPLRIPSAEEAEEAIVRRHLSSFGPASAKDIQAWSGMYLEPIYAALERLRDSLVRVIADGTEGNLLKKDVADLESCEPDQGVVRLLPSFDPYVLGHFDRRLLIDRKHYGSVYKDAGWLAPVVLVDGRVVGTWAYERQTRKLAVEVRLFVPLDSKTRRRVEEQVRDLARFLGLSDAVVGFRT